MNRIRPTTSKIGRKTTTRPAKAKITIRMTPIPATIIIIAGKNLIARYKRKSAPIIARKVLKRSPPFTAH
jgi:hypothetical protein